MEPEGVGGGEAAFVSVVAGLGEADNSAGAGIGVGMGVVEDEVEEGDTTIGGDSRAMSVAGGETSLTTDEGNINTGAGASNSLFFSFLPVEQVKVRVFKSQYQSASLSLASSSVDTCSSIIFSGSPHSSSLVGRGIGSPLGFLFKTFCGKITSCTSSSSMISCGKP